MRGECVMTAGRGGGGDISCYVLCVCFCAHIYINYTHRTSFVGDWLLFL